MTRKRTNRIFLLAVAILLLFVGALARRIYSQMHQDALNRALIAEIKKQSGATKAKTDALVKALERSGNWDRMDIVLRHGDPEGERIFSGTADRVKRLLNEGASPNARDETGSVPLSFWDHLRVLLHLTKPKQGGGKPALSLALDGDDPEIVKTLVEQGANTNVVGNGRLTPLEWSSDSPDPTITRILLEKGVRANSREGASALETAAMFGNLEVMKVLLAYGANVNGRPFRPYSPLMMTIDARVQLPVGRASVVIKLLLDHNADVNIKAPTDGETALSLAREGMAHPRGPNLDVQLQDKRELTAIIRLLKQHGAKE